MVITKFKYALLVLIVSFYSCSFKISKSYLKRVRSANFKEISQQSLALFYNQRIDTSTLTKNIPVNSLQQKLKALKIESVGISFSDSTIVYWKKVNHFELRLYPWVKGTYIFYDFANSQRSLSTSGGYLDTGDMQVAERLYVGKFRQPGIR